MPTEREHSKHNPDIKTYNDLGHDVSKFKEDRTQFTSKWLHTIWQNQPCVECQATRKIIWYAIVYSFALYGAYTFYTHIV